MHVRLFNIIITILISLAGTAPANAIYNKDVEKALKKQYYEPVYIPHSDCYLVKSKADKEYFGVCTSKGTELVPTVFKKCSFEKSTDGRVFIFAERPNFKAPSPGSRVYSLNEEREVLNIGNSTPIWVDGDYITSFGGPIYRLDGSIALDCAQMSVVNLRRGNSIVGYKVSVRNMIGGKPVDNLVICDNNFRKLFELDGQPYLWDVVDKNDANGSYYWQCSMKQGRNEPVVLAFDIDGTPIGLPSAPATVSQASMAVAPAPTPASTPAPAQPARQTTTSKPAFGIASSVDRNIPKSGAVASNTFAVVIANENYTEVENVPFAANDGKIFAQYCEQALGIPAKNIRLVQDATLNQIKRQLHWLKQISDAYDSDIKVIFYYSGHGIPDEKSKEAYLLPVDGFYADITTNLAVSDLYKSLNDLKTNQVMVFLDACFSGAQRGDNMLVSARGVKIKPKQSNVSGNMLVLSAAKGDETAYPLTSERHGLFTYYLLKKIQETGSNITIGDLSDFVITSVKKESLLQNDKIQTPTIMVSPTLQASWRDLRL
ncbi:MAG: caspase family protein [Muribaculaceae bacterium]|nr:caspase family protein [Muribaculaceae bacterium]